MEIGEIKLDRITGKSLDELMADHPWEVFRLWDGLEEKKFTIADINADHRSILHWEKEGLLETSKVTKDGWRRFSFFDYVWIRLMINMREFGLPLPILKNVKKAIFAPFLPEVVPMIEQSHIDDMNKIFGQDFNDKIKKIQSLPESPDVDLEKRLSSITLLIFAIIMIISSRSPGYLLIAKDGDTKIVMLEEPGLKEKIEIMLSLLKEQSSLCINITKIIDEFFSSEKFSGSTFYKLSLLSNQEQEIIDIIRSGGVKNISITLKDGNQFYTEVIRKRPAKNVMEQIKEIIAKNKFSRITLDTEKGEVRYINETEKIIIK